MPESISVQSAGKPSCVASIIGDGNCFFRTISYFVTGSERFHGELRSLVVSHMDVVRVPLENSSLDDKTSLPDYVTRSRMLLDGTWATDVEIFVTAHLLGTDVFVYSAGNNVSNPRWHRFQAKFLERNRQTSYRSIYMNHKYGNRYEAVLSV